MRKELPEYEVWKNMRRRCNDPSNIGYARYGGRGITVCSRWDDFLAFLDDMGPRPSPEHTLERIDSKSYGVGISTVWRIKHGVPVRGQEVRT